MLQMIRLLLVAMLSVCLAAPVFALELGTNITIFDENGSTSDGSNIGHEDGETEPGMVNSQDWDLEGFFLNQNSLSMVGGYNFVTGEGDYTSGDIFISTGSLTSGDDYGDIHRTGDDEYTTDTGYAYDFVLDMSFNDNGGSYTVYAIDENTILQTAFYNENEGSSPWQYNHTADSGGVATDYSGTFSFLSGLTDTDTGFSGGTHYALTGFDLSFLAAETDFYAHFTMGCGNDNLMGQGTTAPVPEPSTLVLMGAGGVLLWLVRRRKANK